LTFIASAARGWTTSFPTGVKESVRLLDVLQWFCDCVDQGEPSTLIQLMWKDVVGPSLAEFQADEAVESHLLALFKQGDLKDHIRQWDLERRANGGVNLTLRTVLKEIHELEQAQNNRDIDRGC
jgi:hypothetical protein